MSTHREEIERRAAKFMSPPASSWQQALEMAAAEYGAEMAEQQKEPELDIKFPIPTNVRAQSLQFLEELQHAWDLHLRKSAGYSGHSDDVWANFRTGKLGVNDGLGIAVRLNDKFNRLVSIVGDPSRDQVNEPLQELLSDIAAYCYIWKCILREQDNARTVVVEVMDTDQNATEPERDGWPGASV